MKNFVKLAIASLVLLVSSCCEPNWADKDEYMFLGKERFWVHGYVDERGYENYTEMVITRWKIDGHDYMYVNGYTEPIHLPSCKACETRRDSVYNVAVNTIQNYIDKKIDSLATVYGKKTNEVKTLVEKKTREIKHYWDNPPIDYD